MVTFKAVGCKPGTKNGDNIANLKFVVDDFLENKDWSNWAPSLEEAQPIHMTPNKEAYSIFVINVTREQ